MNTLEKGKKLLQALFGAPSKLRDIPVKKIKREGFFRRLAAQFNRYPNQARARTMLLPEIPSTYQTNRHERRAEAIQMRDLKRKQDRTQKLWDKNHPIEGVIEL